MSDLNTTPTRRSALQHTVGYACAGAVTASVIASPGHPQTQNGPVLHADASMPSTTSFKGVLRTEDILATGTFGLAIELSGQPAGIRASWFRTGSRPPSSNNMHFGSVTEITDRHGNAASGYKQSTVGAYTGCHGHAGGGAIIGSNVLAQSLPGHQGLVEGLEVNVNIANNGTTAGRGIGEYLVDKPACAGVAVIGNCRKPLSYVFGANLLAGGMRTYAGLALHNGTVEGPIIDLKIHGTHVIQSAGNKTVGIDLSGDVYSTGYSLFQRNGHAIAWKGARESDPRASISYEAGNFLVVRGPGLRHDGNFAPLIDNARDVGLPDRRYGTIHLVDPPTVSSDARLKTDVEEIDGATAVDIVRALRPVIYRWINGGVEVEERTEEVVVHASEVDASGERVYLFDHQPALDEEGRHIIERQFVRGAQVAVPRYETNPRQARETQPASFAVPREGRRRHAGFLYQEVEAALLARGLDLGLCVRDEKTDTLSLRCERLIPVFMKAFTHRDTEIESRLAAIESRLDLTPTQGSKLRG